MKTEGEDLRSLLAFQGAVSVELARSADLDEAMAATEERLKTAREDPRERAGVAKREAALSEIGTLRHGTGVANGGSVRNLVAPPVSLPSRDTR